MNISKLTAEFVGTFFLVLTVGLTAGHTDFAPLAIGSVLMVMVYACGPTSGAHLNPAVTLGVLLTKNISSGEAIQYIVTQVIAGFVAAIVAGLLVTSVGHPAPGANVNMVTAIIAEIVFTFALVFTVLHVAVSKRAGSNSYFGLAIGFSVLVGAWAVGGISGGAFNPAVGTGPVILNGGAANLLIYWVGPLAGGALAAIVYGITHASDVD